jgi:ribosomal-protein-alanine N-acetyltransferase
MNARKKSIFLETQRLALFVPREEDLDDQLLLQSNDEVMKYIGGGARTKEKVQEVLKDSIEHYDKFQFSLGSVFEKSTGQFIGRAGLIHLGFVHTAPEIEICCALLPGFWRKGYGIELAQALIQWGFEHLDVSELAAVTKKENLASRNALEKVGMTYKKDIVYPYSGMTSVYYSTNVPAGGK